MYAIFCKYRHKTKTLDKKQPGPFPQPFEGQMDQTKQKTPQKLSVSPAFTHQGDWVLTPVALFHPSLALAQALAWVRPWGHSASRVWYAGVPGPRPQHGRRLGWIERKRCPELLGSGGSLRIIGPSKLAILRTLPLLYRFNRKCHNPPWN